MKKKFVDNLNNANILNKLDKNQHQEEEEEEDSFTESLEMPDLDEINIDDTVEKKENLTNEEQKLNEIEKYIKKNKKKDFKDQYIFKIEFPIKKLKNYKFALINIKEETDDDNIRNKAIELKNAIPGLQIKLFELYISRLKKEEFENLDKWKIDNHTNHSHIKFLNKCKPYLAEIEKEANNDNIRNRAAQLKNDVHELQIILFEAYLPKLEKENFDYIWIRQIAVNIAHLKDYTLYFIEMEKETNDDNIRNKAIELKNDIPNILIKIFETYIPQLEKENFEDNYTATYMIREHIDCLKEYETTLIKIKEETKNNYTKNKINELMNKLTDEIPKLLIKLFKAFLPKFEIEYFKNEWTFSQTKYHFKSLKEYKSILIKIKEKNYNNKKIEELKNIIENIIIKIFDKHVNNIENDFKEQWKIDIKSSKQINNDIKFLDNYESNLKKIKGETKNNYTKNKIDELINISKNKIPELKVKLIEIYIPKLTKEYFEEKHVYKIRQNIRFLEDYELVLTKIKTETKDNYTKINIDKLINKSKDFLPNLLIKLIAIYIPKIERKSLKKVEVQEINYHIDYLKDYIKRLTNQDIKDKIYKMIIKLENKVKDQNENNNEIKKKLIEIETDIKNMEQNNPEYMYKFNIKNRIHHLIYYKQTLLELKAIITNEDIKNKIYILINKIHNLLIKFFEIYLTYIENEDFEKMKTIKACSIIWFINNLKNCKQTLTDLKKEITNLETLNKIDELMNIIPYILIKLFEIYIPNLKKYFDKKEVQEINELIEYLKNSKKELTNPKTKDKIDEIIIELGNIINLKIQNKNQNE